MKKAFILIQILMGSFICAIGIPQKDSLNYYYVQLKIVNLSDYSIDFYYNDLNYVNTHLNKGEEEIVYKTPITDDYPGFFAIDRGDGNLEIYSTHYINEVKVEYCYTVLIYNESVEIYNTLDISKDYKELLEDINYTYPWDKIEIDGMDIIVEIQNITGFPITIGSNGYAFGKNIKTEIVGGGTIEPYNYINLENGAKCVYTINDKIFSLKYIYFKIFYTKIYDNKELTSWQRQNETININNEKHKNIIIVLKGYDNGYEINYE
jgi:hypothetical protein